MLQYIEDGWDMVVEETSHQSSQQLCGADLEALAAQITIKYLSDVIHN